MKKAHGKNQNSPSPPVGWEIIILKEKEKIRGFSKDFVFFFFHFTWSGWRAFFSPQNLEIIATCAQTKEAERYWSPKAIIPSL